MACRPCRDLHFTPVFSLLKIGLVVKSKARRKVMKDSTARISHSEKLRTVQEILFKKSVVCFWMIIARLPKKKTGSLEMCAADWSELHKQLLL